MLGHKHLLLSINITLAEILKLAGEYIVNFLTKIAVINSVYSLPVIGKEILLNFRQNNKQQSCSVAPYMNVTGAYTMGSELVFVSAATGASVSR